MSDKVSERDGWDGLIEEIRKQIPRPKHKMTDFLNIHIETEEEKLFNSKLDSCF